MDGDLEPLTPVTESESGAPSAVAVADGAKTKKAVPEGKHRPGKQQAAQGHFGAVTRRVTRGAARAAREALQGKKIPPVKVIVKNGIARVVHSGQRAGEAARSRTGAESRNAREDKNGKEDANGSHGRNGPKHDIIETFSTSVTDDDPAEERKVKGTIGVGESQQREKTPPERGSKKEFSETTANTKKKNSSNSKTRKRTKRFSLPDEVVRETLADMALSPTERYREERKAVNEENDVLDTPEGNIYDQADEFKKQLSRYFRRRTEKEAAELEAVIKKPKKKGRSGRSAGYKTIKECIYYDSKRAPPLKLELSQTEVESDLAMFSESFMSRTPVELESYMPPPAPKWTSSTYMMPSSLRRRAGKVSHSRVSKRTRKRSSKVASQSKPKINPDGDDWHKNFESHKARKGWLQCVSCSNAIWAPNARKHLKDCAAFRNQK